MVHPLGKIRQSTEMEELVAPSWRCPACRCVVTGAHSITVGTVCSFFIFLIYFFVCLQRHEQLFRRGMCSAPTIPMIITIPEAPMPPPSACKIARRFPGFVNLPTKVVKLRRIDRMLSRGFPKHPRDISHIQFKWRMYLRHVRELCEPAFWQFFLPMHHLPAVSIDTALHSARSTFQAHRFTSFPMSMRTLLQKVNVSSRITKCHYKHLTVCPDATLNSVHKHNMIRPHATTESSR